MAMHYLAPQSCHACRRLKRKCTRDMPSCSLCARLNKTCEYPYSSTRDSDISPASQNSETTSEVVSRGGRGQTMTPDCPDTIPFASISGPNHPLPTSFFLDTDYFTMLTIPSLSSVLPRQIQEIVSTHVGQDFIGVCETYLGTVHQWLPMISRKRLINELSNNTEDADGCVAILLLCMKLNSPTDRRKTQSARELPIYMQARPLISAVEGAGFVSLRLVQALILLAVYELGHGIYPAAYLTVGRAARLAAMTGMHNRKHAQQMFKSAETWTLGEEQRRTWSAIFILDRFVNIGTSGLPLAAPEPHAFDLLPINDHDWDNGNIVPNEPVYTTAFYGAAAMGSFARTFQAAHILDKVLHHRETEKTSTDTTELLAEAQNLHWALSALQSSLEDQRDSNKDYSSNSPLVPSSSALALCSTARLLLYNLYACNDPGGSADRERIAMETGMQHMSFSGIKDVVFRTVPVVALAATSGKCTSPLMAHCLYHAATECAWFIREDHETSTYTALDGIIRGLRALGENWGVARDYIDLLVQGDILKLLDDKFGAGYADSLI